MSTETLASSVIRTSRYRVLLYGRSVRLIALLLVCLVAPLSDAFRVAGLSNRDIWWHLRTGAWILQNHAVPHTGLFSQDAAAPWVASTWGFDVLCAAAYKLLGLRAIPTLLIIFTLAVALITLVLGYGYRGRFWRAVLLSAVAQYVLADLVLLPGAVSIIFFGIELFLLLQTRRSGNLRPLYWMPLLFLLWANLHVQFVDGLLLLGLFLSVEALERVLRKWGSSFFAAPSLPLDKAAAVAGLSMFATLLTPYTFHIFADVVKNTYSDVLFNNFLDMTPLAFRKAQDFLFALLVMAAFLVLGRERTRDLFKLALMVITALVGFRIERDAWLTVLAAIAILGDTTSDAEFDSIRGNITPTRKLAAVTAAILIVLTGSMIRLPANEALMDSIGKVFPRRACDFIRANRLPAPLFNAYGWGGFLIWYLPEYPVVIDSRYNLYSSETTNNYFKTIAGAERLEANAGFTHARTMLLEKQAPLTRALTNLPVLKAQFEVAYEDEIAVVLLRRQADFAQRLDVGDIDNQEKK